MMRVARSMMILMSLLTRRRMISSVSVARMIRMRMRMTKILMLMSISKIKMTMTSKKKKKTMMISFLMGLRSQAVSRSKALGLETRKCWQRTIRTGIAARRAVRR